MPKCLPEPPNGRLRYPTEDSGTDPPMFSIPPVKTALAVAVLGLVLATPAVADRPASIAPDAQRRAEVSFASFAAGWMADLQHRMARERDKPRLRAGALAPVATFREIADDYTIELQVTGRPQAPYVGVVHYPELVFTCANLATRDCPLAMESPVSEIFRYRAGRWVY